MMSTPTPIGRRPRPPGGRSRSNLHHYTNVDDMPAMPGSFDSASRPTASGKPPLVTTRSTASFASSSSQTIIIDTPLAASHRDRTGMDGTAVSWRSHSPDVGNISAGLDVDVDEDEESSVRPAGTCSRSSIGSDLDPSPPPPYGRDLPGGPDLASSKRPVKTVADQTAEHMRASRAAEAARALGLDIEFATSEPGTPASEADMNEMEMKARYREARRQLQQREIELQMAAQVADQMLRRHEQHMAKLPTQLGSKHSTNQVRSPHERRQTLSTPSSQGSPASIFKSTPGHMPQPLLQQNPNLSYPSRKLVRPLPNGRNTSTHSRATNSLSERSQPIPARAAEYAILERQEHDDRVAALEDALAEAREGEEAQRKLAARIRRDFEKLRREYDRAEEVMARSQEQRPLNIGTPRERIASAPAPRVTWRNTQHAARDVVRPKQFPTNVREEDEVEYQLDHLGAADSSLPRSLRQTSRNFEDTSQDLGHSFDRPRQQHTTVGLPSLASARSNFATQNAPTQDDDTSSPESVGGATLHRANSLTKHEAKRLILPSSILPLLVPKSPLAPRVTIQAPNSPSTSSAGLSAVSRAAQSRRRDPSPYPSPQPSLASTPASSAFFDPTFSPLEQHALSGLTARMMHLREASNLSPTPNKTCGKTLGAELAREISIECNNDTRSVSNVSQRYLASELSYDDGSMVDMPHPLPSSISAALSGLALALGSTPLPGQSEDIIDRRIDELLHEAARLRSIRWADDGTSLMAPTPMSARHANLNSSRSELEAIVETWRSSLDATTIAEDEEDFVEDEMDEGDIQLDSITADSNTAHELENLSMILSAPTRPSPRPVRPTIALAHRRTESLQTIQTLQYALSHPQYRQQMQQHTIDEIKQHRSQSIEALSLEVKSLQFETQSIRTSMTTSTTTTLVMEPVTVPGRVVNDFICLTLLVLDWVEMLLIVTYRVIMDIKHTEMQTFGDKVRSGRKRYYL